jgi:hypothetical protein
MNRKSIPTTYTEALDTLAGRDSRRIANNTTLVDLGDGAIGLRLHSTAVVTFRPDGSLVLNTGGWHTTTTKDRLNRVLRASGYGIFAKRFDWYVSAPDGSTFAYEDGWTIPPAPARAPEAREWKDGEVGYCLGLVRSCGNQSVPRRAVESYLKVQVASATRDGAHAIAADLARAAFYIGQDNWDAAERVLSEACPDSEPARDSEPIIDARVENHGSLFLVRALTDCALAWLEEHTDGQWLGNGLAVEHRYVTDLVAGLRDAGFIVEAA